MVPPAALSPEEDIHRPFRSSSSSRKGGGMSFDDGDSIFENAESRTRYEAYSRLQASAVAFGEKLPIPEIVAVGGQSDGKSSLLEALLGFRFNVREVEMGTRRPLMLQMVHDPSALEPRCRLQDENSDEYGAAIDPPSAVAEAVRSRTEAHLRQLGGGAAVSSKPIVMRAEYAYCPNLTIIDCPGFVLSARKGEPEGTPGEIMSMVKTLAAPPHRIILFLQQSSVEWVSSLWLDAVREVDPTLRRTVIVASKFDNRLKVNWSGECEGQEFAERWEVDRYLSANGVLGENMKPFFVALPKDRALVSNAEFRRQIAAVDSDVLKQLREGIAGGFDEERFGGQIGFGNLRKYLELELQRRYREAAPATLALLERRCSEVADELSLADTRLATAGDIAGLRRAAMMHTASVASHVVALLNGRADPDPGEWGRTTEEEREESALARWPGVVGDVKPSYANLRLYGGAAFERLLDEFRCAAFSLDCPAVTTEKVANILLAHAGKQGGPVAAAGDIARSEARRCLGPLLDTACDRLAHVLKCLFDLALERFKMEAEGEPGASEGRMATSTLNAYVAFHAALRKAHDRFVRKLASQCKDRARHHLIAATSPFSPTETWEPMYSSQQLSFGEQLFSSGLYHPEQGMGGGNMGGSMRGEFPTGESTPNIHTRNNQSEDTGEIGHNNGKYVVKGSPPEDGQEFLRESQITVPETPSPDQGSTDMAASRRKEYAQASGRSAHGVINPTANGTTANGNLGGILKRFNTQVGANAVNGPVHVGGGGGDGTGQKKRPSAAGPGPSISNGSFRWANGKAPKMLSQGKSEYGDVCAMMTEQFGRIREVVAHRLVPSTLSAGFITPCREQLGISLAVELFACEDEAFMEMFVAPGAVESLRASKVGLQRRSETLEKCMQEFRMLARTL